MADDLGVAPEESSSFATPQEPAASGLRSTWPWLVTVGVIVVVAAVLRFWELGRQSMWLDELYTFNATAYGPLNAIKATSRDTNPPLFYVLQSLSLMALDRSEWAMRALSAVAGVLATAVMYLAGAKLLSRRTGAWAAAMFAVSLIAVRYAQEARMYSLVMLIAALELWLFARLLERPTVTRAVLLGVAIGALAYTHVYGYIAAPMLLVPVLLLPRVRSRVGSYIAVAYAVTGLLFLRWAFIIPAQIELVQSQAGAGTWWMSPPDDLIASMVYHFAELAPRNDAVVSLVFVALIFAGFAIRDAAAENPVAVPAEAEGIRESDIRWVLLAVAVLPILAGLVVSLYVTPIGTIRNTLVSLPALYILAVHGGLKIPKHIGVFVLSGLMVAALVGLPELYSSTQKGAWRQAAELVTANPNTGVVAQEWVSASNIDAYATFLRRTDSLDLIWANSLDATPSPGGQHLNDGEVIALPAWVESRDRVFVVAESRDAPAFQLMDEFKGWELVATHELGLPVVGEYQRVGGSTTPTAPPPPIP